MENPSDLEGRAAFGGFIGPKRLKSLVKNTSPWQFDGTFPPEADRPARRDARLIELGDHPLGFWAILQSEGHPEACETPTPEQWTDYFALCVACHFASVASFVPTDVDTKIRSHLWFQDRPTAEHDRMRDFALGLARWDITGISARVVDVDGAGPVSGHDGERLSVLGGAYLGCLKIEDQSGADAVLAAIEAELAREAQAFDTLVRSYGRERDLLIVAAAMTHNAGDLDQGFSAEKGKRFGADAKAAFGRLAHDEPKRFGGAFAKAAALYKDILASEGHRHYPLREIRPLRAHPRLLLPVGPFFDQWGETLATWPEWDLSTRAHVIDGVVQACGRVAGQKGYYRALAGFDRSFGGGLESPLLVRNFGSATRRDLKDPELRQKIAVRRESFESSLGKQARKVLASLR